MTGTKALRLSDSGKRLHKCSQCGVEDYWRDGWVWFGSLKDEDDGVDVPRYCPECAAKLPGAASASRASIHAGLHRA